MSKKRPSALDALGDVAPPLPPNTTATVEAPPAINRYNKPTTYRLPESLVERLKEIADTERVKISDLVTFALQHFVTDYENGQIVLPKSEPSRYKLGSQ